MQLSWPNAKVAKNPKLNASVNVNFCSIVFFTVIVSLLRGSTAST